MILSIEGNIEAGKSTAGASDSTITTTTELRS